MSICSYLNPKALLKIIEEREAKKQENKKDEMNKNKVI